MFTNNGLRNGISECLAKLPDLKRLTSRLSSKKCSLIDCCKIYQSFFFIKNLIELLESERNQLIEDEFLTKLKEANQKCSNFSKLIEETVDRESLENGDPLINSSYDEELTELADQMKSAMNKAEKVYSRIERELNLKNLKFENEPLIGFVARITLKQENAIRGKDAYRVVGTKKDGVRFTTIELDKYSKTYLDLRSSYEEIQAKIFDSILETLRTYQKPLESLNSVLAKLDVYFSISDCAKDSAQVYVRPTLLKKGTGKIKLTNLRHPCLENQINVYYIPNSIDFDKDNKKFFIVTGPNMGGKSTFLRSIGIAVLLTQIGSFVPAEEAEISIVDGIFTRIGASDKQFKGISTFKAEMLETSEILKNATEDSLVIIDELGRGTSTFDGCGLAYGISKEIALNIKSYCLFATHFHELTLLSNEIASVENLFVDYQFDEQDFNIKMLYQVKRGICDQKFGIHVAKMVELPNEMIEFAKEKVQKYEKIENPPNKDQLEKISNAIKQKVKNEQINLKEMKDEELLSYLNQIANEFK